MPNFATTIKQEITRLAAKEVRKGTPGLKRASIRYRREIASLKREIGQAVKRLNFLLKQHAASTPVRAAKGQQIRFSPKWLKRHREKLDLSAQQ